MAAPHMMLDLSDAGRLLVGGDIHGHLDRLKEALERVEYDPAAGDRLVLLGDLLDRGPDVLAIHEWLLANPEVIHLLGNHDEMLLASLGLRPMDRWNNPDNLVHNGGGWLLDFVIGLSEDEGVSEMISKLIEHEGDDPPPFIDHRVMEFARHMAQSPVAATVLTPWGRRVALVHADIPRATWNETVAALESPDAREAHATRIAVTWERRLFNRMERALGSGPAALSQLDIGIPDVDHVFLGHSIVAEPTTAANLTWLDTGPYRGNPITILDVDAWLDTKEAGR